jgi:hypothetical protein
LEDGKESFNGGCPSETTFIVLLWDMAQVNLTTRFCPFMKISLKFIFQLTFYCQQTASAKCTHISSVRQCQKVHLFDSGVENAGCYFCNDKFEWLSFHTANILNRAFTQYLALYSRKTPAGVRTSTGEENCYWLKSGQN